MLLGQHGLELILCPNVKVTLLKSVLVPTVSSLHLIWTFTRWYNHLPLTMHPDSIDIDPITY